MWKWIRRTVGGAALLIPNVPQLLKQVPGLPGVIDDLLTWGVWGSAIVYWSTGMAMPLWGHALIVAVALCLLTWDWWAPHALRLLNFRKQSPELEGEEARPELQAALPVRDYTNRTPKEIIDEAHFHHFQDEPWTSPEIGRWLRFEGNIWASPDTRPDPIEVTMDSRGDGGLLILNFDNDSWCDRLAALKARECIKGKGKITQVSWSSMTLRDCELLGVVE